MKPIEEAFSSSGFRRVVLPGVVLTIGLHPLISRLTKAALPSYGVTEVAVVLVAEVILWGLVLSSSINAIYYVYEGISLPWLTAIAKQLNVRRLEATIAEYEAMLNGRVYADLSDEEKLKAALIHERLTDFPLRKSASGAPARYAPRSTMLGNIIATYEFYSQSRYGVDGVFYWFHFLALAPEPAAKEFNENYAFAESLILTSGAGAVVAIINFVALLGLGIGAACDRLALITSPISAHAASSLAFVGLLVFVLFYLLALPAHREAGRVFRSVVDLSIKGLDDWSKETSAPVSVEADLRISTRKRYLNSLR